MNFFLIAVVSPLCILDFSFHIQWLQFLFHQKFPLLSYDLNTVSLSGKDVKSLLNKFLKNTFWKFIGSHSQMIFKIGVLNNTQREKLCFTQFSRRMAACLFPTFFICLHNQLSSIYTIITL